MSFPWLKDTAPASPQIAPRGTRRSSFVGGGLSRAAFGRLDPAIVGLTILALGMGFYRLDAKSLGHDELVSAAHARLDLAHLWTVITTHDPNMALYYVLLHFWVRIFGYTAPALRSLSVVAGALAVPVTIVLGRRLFGRPVGAVAGLLLAISPFLIHSEQTARSYALLVTLVALSWYFFVAALERPTTGSQVGFVLTISLAILTHYMAAYVLLVQVLVLLAVKRRSAFTRRWLMTAVAVALLCAAVAVALPLGRALHGIGWIRDPPLRWLFGLPIQLAGGRALGVVLVILGCYGLLRVFRAFPRWRVGLVTAWCIGPVLLDFTVSKLVQPMFLSYYLITVLPAFLLLAAVGLVKLPGRTARLSGLTLVVVLSVILISNWYTHAGGRI